MIDVPVPASLVTIVVGPLAVLPGTSFLAHPQRGRPGSDSGFAGLLDSQVGGRMAMRLGCIVAVSVQQPSNAPFRIPKLFHAIARF